MDRKQVEKVGVGWDKEFKNGKKGIKLSINKQIFVAYRNMKKKPEDEKAPDYVIVKFIDTPVTQEKK